MTQQNQSILSVTREKAEGVEYLHAMHTRRIEGPLVAFELAFRLKDQPVGYRKELRGSQRNMQDREIPS